MSAPVSKLPIRNLAEAASDGIPGTPSRFCGLFLQRVSAASGRRLQTHRARARNKS